MTEATKGIGQKFRKGATADCFLFEGCFSSNKTGESATVVGAELVSMVRKNTKGFFKETIEKLTKNWAGGSYLVLSSKPMVPGGRLLIAIDYKYNARKVLSFIFIDN